MAGIVGRPAQYSYQTGNPTQGETRNTNLKQDFSGQLSKEEGKLPANAQEHFKKQRQIQNTIGQQVLAVSRGGGVLKRIKGGPS